MWLRTWPIDANAYGAEGAGARGDGERVHRHTVAQSFRVTAGLALVQVDGVDHLLRPGERAWAPSLALHGLWVLAPGTRYESIFWEPAGGPVDQARIHREQVPSISPDEARARAKALDAAGWPASVEELATR